MDPRHQIPGDSDFLDTWSPPVGSTDHVKPDMEKQIQQ